MGNCRKRPYGAIAAIISAMFLMHASIASASEITGINGNNGVYDINPSALVNGTDIGYRKYIDFILDHGDIANLIFKYGNTDINTFVNLVDNQVVINGLVNSMRGNNFYNGKVVFISPKGMVVGASGVLNVGSLSIATPSLSTYEHYRSNPSADLSGLYSDAKNNSAVRINGKVIAAKNVDITSGNVNIAQGSNILAGAGHESLIGSSSDAEALFNALVNTDNLRQSGALVSNEGNIEITTGVGTVITGDLKNIGSGHTKITNTGAEGVVISGNSYNKYGDTIVNNSGQAGINITGNVVGKDVYMTNSGEKGLILASNSKVTALDSMTLKNTSEGTDGLNVYGKTVSGGNTTMINDGEKGLNIKENASVKADGDIVLTNSGKDGLNIVENTVVEGKNVILNNTGSQGIMIDSAAKVNANNDLTINNTVTAQGADGTETGKVNIKGLIKAANDILIKSTGGDIVIGDNTANDNYVTAGRNINITANKANVYNYDGEHGKFIPHSDLASAKILLNAGGDLTINATDGQIGREVGAGCNGGYCSGINNDPNTRDFAKSINAKVDEKVNMTTTKDSTINDLVINYASFNSDMNIDHIKADGRVILTADYNREDGTTRYSLKNVSSDPTKANVEGYGISMIASKSIGEKDNKLTFNQTKAGEFKTGNGGYGMDVLANENIYIKGLDDKYTVNNVCSMIAREGEIEAEFSGDTYIEEVTSEKDLTLITRGKKMEINHLGTVPNTPVDYFGDRNQGLIADNNNFNGAGYTGEGEKDAIPNNAYVKALDINKNIRPNGEDVNGYYAWADSEVRINNGRLDNGKMEVTADNIYANGVEAHFNKDGFTKTKDPSTNKIEGVSDIPTGKAVRPEDVTGIGRDEHERNYYYPQGDGDFKGNPYDNNNGKTDVDPDDDKVDATPLDLEPEYNNPNPPNPPQPPVVDDDDDDDNKPNVDGSIMYIQRKIDEQDFHAIDKRQYVRYQVASNQNPISIEKSENVSSLLDISRGGVSVAHNDSLKVGDVVPVHIAYGDIDFNADVKIISATTSRAGGQFVNLDQATANKILFMNMLLYNRYNSNLISKN